MKTPITFDAALLTPVAIREMAHLARLQRDALDGVSAAHYTAWDNLAKTLKSAADEREAAAIIEDLLDDERETLTDALVHETEFGSAGEPVHETTMHALAKAGLVEPWTDTDVEVELTTRGRRIARRLAA